MAPSLAHPPRAYVCHAPETGALLACSGPATPPVPHCDAAPPSAAAPPFVRTGHIATHVAERSIDPGLHALVRCAQEGDRDAFQEVAERFGPPLLRFVRRYLNNDAASAPDIVQDTLLTAWSHIRTIRDGAHFEPWLYTVARNKALSLQRARRRNGPPPLTLLEDPVDFRLPSPAEAAGFERRIGPHLLSLLVATISELPMHYRAVIRLYYLRDLDTSAVALAMGIGRGSVKMRLLRARRILAKRLPPAVARACPATQAEFATFMASLAKRSPP